MAQPERRELEQQTEPHVATGRRRLSLPPALKYPAYRAYWLGMLASVSGFQMFRAAQAWFVYDLTGSPMWLGIAAAANAVPAIFFNLFGGVFADKVDKRRLIIATQIMSGFTRARCRNRRDFLLVTTQFMGGFT